MIRRTSSPAILPASLVACRCASEKYAGTVMTACLTSHPRNASASDFIFCRIIAEISCGEYFLPSISTFASEPIFRLIDITVRSGLVIACRFAT